MDICRNPIAAGWRSDGIDAGAAGTGGRGGIDHDLEADGIVAEMHVPESMYRSGEFPCVH